MAQDSMRKAFTGSSAEAQQANQATMAGYQALGQGINQAGGAIAEGIKSQAAQNYRAQLDQRKFDQKALEFDLEQRELAMEQQKHADLLVVAHAENGIKAALAQTKALELLNREKELILEREFKKALLEDRQKQTAIKDFRAQWDQRGDIRLNEDTGQYETYGEQDSVKGFGYNPTPKDKSTQTRMKKLHEIQQARPRRGRGKSAESEASMALKQAREKRLTNASKRRFEQGDERLRIAREKLKKTTKGSPEEKLLSKYGKMSNAFKNRFPRGRPWGDDPDTKTAESQAQYDKAAQGLDDIWEKINAGGEFDTLLQDPENAKAFENFKKFIIQKNKK